MSDIDRTPTLIYWKVASRGQLPLLLLSAGNVKYNYDDATANAWPAKKEEMPFGQLPVLKVGDTLIAQSGAIARYCAKISGLMPTDDLEMATVDAVMEQCNDVFNSMAKAKYSTLPPKEAWKTFKHEVLPQKIERINGMLKASGKAFFGGEKPNAADISIFSVLNLVEKAGITLPEWSHVTPLYAAVASVGNIPTYLEQNYSPYFQAE